MHRTAATKSTAGGGAPAGGSAPAEWLSCRDEANE
jgi:hypothetical protein